ncbi:zinc-binding dehydrogenase [Novosphingobium resinovorum]
MIDRSFAFDEAAEAYEHLRAAQHMGKVVIEMT